MVPPNVTGERIVVVIDEIPSEGRGNGSAGRIESGNPIEVIFLGDVPDAEHSGGGERVVAQVEGNGVIGIIVSLGQIALNRAAGWKEIGKFGRIDGVVQAKKRPSRSRGSDEPISVGAGKLAAGATNAYRQEIVIGSARGDRDERGDGDTCLEYGLG